MRVRIRLRFLGMIIHQALPYEPSQFSSPIPIFQELSGTRQLAGSSSGEGECRSAAGGVDEKVQLYPPLEIRLVFQTAEAAAQEAVARGAHSGRPKGGSVAGPSR